MPLPARRSEDVDPDQQVRRFDGRDDHQQAHHRRDGEARLLERGHGHCRGVAMQPELDVQVLDDGRRDEQQHGVHGGHDGRQGAGDEDAAQTGGSSWTIRVGMARSPAGSSGNTARPKAPARWTHRIMKPMNRVPTTMAWCMARESR